MANYKFEIKIVTLYRSFLVVKHTLIRKDFPNGCIQII